MKTCFSGFISAGVSDGDGLARALPRRREASVSLPFSSKDLPEHYRPPVDAGAAGSIVERPCLMIICSGTQG